MGENGEIKDIEKLLYKKQRKIKKSEFFKNLKIACWEYSTKKRNNDGKTGSTKSGVHATVFHSSLYKKDKVMKKLAKPHQGTPQEKLNLELCRSLVGKDLGPNLMKVAEILDDNTIVFEYVDGKTYFDSMTKKFTGTRIEFCGNGVGPGVGLNMDDFIEKWCTGSVSAMEKIKAETGYYLKDRNLGNFIVKNYGQPDAILVLIDYDFQKAPPGLASLVGILIDVMENNLDKSDNRWKPLRNYLESVKNKNYSISRDMLSQFAKIKKE